MTKVIDSVFTSHGSQGSHFCSDSVSSPAVLGAGCLLFEVLFSFNPQFHSIPVGLFLGNLYCVLCTDLLLRNYKTSMAQSLPSTFSPSFVNDRCLSGREQGTSYITRKKRGGPWESILIRSFLKEERFPSVERRQSTKWECRGSSWQRWWAQLFSGEPDRLCLRPADQTFCSELNLKGDYTDVAAPYKWRIFYCIQKGCGTPGGETFEYLRCNLSLKPFLLASAQAQPQGNICPRLAHLDS